ncbi:MAG: hypothetical protein RR295_07710 [Oscillospiraceae bacterium]
MGRQFVDDHRFFLYHDGDGGTDITAAVSAPELQDDLSALSVELSFQAVRNQLRDPYLRWCGAAPGDKLRVMNHGSEIFSGVILSVDLDGSVIANDPGWYLSKSEIVLSCTRVSAADAVGRMCAKAGVAVGKIDLPATRLTEVWTGETPEAILKDILAVCSAETGLDYCFRVRRGALQVSPLPTVPLIAYHKPVENAAAFDITLAKGAVSGSDSMETLINSVLLTESGTDTARVLARAANAASIARYGLQQMAERLTGDESTAQARNRIAHLLAASDRLKCERQVDDIWGADEVCSGALLQFQGNAYGVTGLQRVTAVTHRYGTTHRMSLTVEPYAQQRAAGSGDTITG